MMTDEEFIVFTESTIDKFKGQIDDLAGALGFLLIGRYMGWKVVRLVLSPSKFRKYEGVLGIKFKDELREKDRYTRKSVGLDLVEKVADFWDVVFGKSSFKIDTKDRKQLENT